VVEEKAPQSRLASANLSELDLTGWKFPARSGQTLSDISFVRQTLSDIVFVHQILSERGGYYRSIRYLYITT